MFQSVVSTDIFECQESTVLLVEVDLSAVDDQMEILFEVYCLLMIGLTENTRQHYVLLWVVILV